MARESSDLIKDRTRVTQKPVTLVQELMSVMDDINSGADIPAFSESVFAKEEVPVVAYKLANTAWNKESEESFASGLGLKRRLHETDPKNASYTPKESTQVKRANRGDRSKECCPYCRRKVKKSNFDRHLLVCFKRAENKTWSKRNATKASKYSTDTNSK
eukprot:TRINITY_DN3238_c0_g2_i6.p1 TRINITY_DN3238_c0_g2~~TRINITY_DN3238_c0_g2_i6.p1  ORF type:complete len:160 (+),score=33.47 TRINITY_DN3238_c0_g2_i6:377-856(+)